MQRPRLAISLLALAGVLLAAAPASFGASARARAAVNTHALLTSKDLWATIDVCNASDQPNVLGVRGSMPGDSRAHDKMYMSFRLQYLDRTTMRWINLASAVPAFVAVGSGGSARQGGRSFQLVPVSGRPAFNLRGVVDFQWRRGSTVLVSTSRPTTVGHQALAGADPAGFTAADCLFG
jgi:hypothetical protein